MNLPHLTRIFQLDYACPWCLAVIDKTTAIKFGPYWYCNDEHAALEQEVSGF